MAARSCSSSPFFFAAKTHNDYTGWENFPLSQTPTALMHVLSLRPSSLFGPMVLMGGKPCQEPVPDTPSQATSPELLSVTNAQLVMAASSRSTSTTGRQEREGGGGRRRKTGYGSLRQSAPAHVHIAWKETNSRRSWTSGSGVGILAATAGLGMESMATEEECCDEGGKAEERRHDDNDDDNRRHDREVPYDWRAEWYPVYYSQDFPVGKPVAVSIFDMPLVMYRDDGGVVRCVEDMCPHRKAKLSEGQVLSGRLECLYHGWQFEGESGKCVRIPQLAAGARIPLAACLKTYPVAEKDGYIYVYPTAMSDLVRGEEEGNRKDANFTSDSPSVSSNSSDLRLPDRVLQKLPDWSHFQRSGFTFISSQSDLPYDHSFLLENIMDPAHLHISHAETVGGGSRARALPMGMQLVEQSDRGFKGFFPYRSNTEGQAATPQLLFHTEFRAPCHIISEIRYDPLTEGEDDNHQGTDKFMGSVVIASCVPLGIGRSRFFFSSRVKKDLTKVFPRWMLHLSAMRILEQDMGLITSQETNVRALLKKNKPLSRLYLALETSDLFLVEYRKWVDKVGHGMPYFEGYRTSKLVDEMMIPAAHEQMRPLGVPQGVPACSTAAQGNTGSAHWPNTTNRYWWHVVNCASCLRAVRNFRILRNACTVLSVVTGVTALLLGPGKQRAAVALLCGLMIAAVYAIETQAIARFHTAWLRPHKQ